MIRIPCKVGEDGGKNVPFSGTSRVPSGFWVAGLCASTLSLWYPPSGMSGSSLTTTGSENMEGFGCRDRCWFLSISRETANWLHNQSGSMVEAEGGAGEASGIRNHWIGGIPQGGRRGGGYSAGNE